MLFIYAMYQALSNGVEQSNVGSISQCNIREFMYELSWLIRPNIYLIHAKRRRRFCRMTGKCTDEHALDFAQQLLHQSMQFHHCLSKRLDERDV